MKKIHLGISVFAIVTILGIVGYFMTNTNIKAGYVGYVYDRTLKPNDERVIQGTSVINKAQTGRIFINPFTQEIQLYPTTIVAKNWTSVEEGDNKGVDWSVDGSSIEGKKITADVYISVKPKDIGKIISQFGFKSFDVIVNDDIYGLARGKLSSVEATFSIYDVQAKKALIQEKTKELLTEELENVYGVELVKYEIASLKPDADIQSKINQKTEAINSVELAKLEQEKKNVANSTLIAEQKATSEKELIQKQMAADAQAYEITKKAEANKQAAALDLETAKLQKQAEQEKQQTYTEKYLQNKELDLKYEAINKINNSLKIIIDSGDGSGIEQIPVIKEILKSME